MKKILVFLLLLPLVHAQLDWAITDLRCGNDKLDDFELCDKNVEEGFCDELGVVLEIDTVCDIYHCTCLPRVNKAYCGNNIREGVEVCDGSGEDRCSQFGLAINKSLTCNKKTCGCDLNETLPPDYSPLVVEGLANASEIESKCGDKKVERAEDCDPPDTLCTTGVGDAGICTDKCKCVTFDKLGVEEVAVSNVTNTTNNGTANLSVENVSNDSVVNVSVEVNESGNVSAEPEKVGFLTRLWNWLASFFS